MVVKKVFATLLAAALLFGVATTAIAAVNPSANITGMAGGLSIGFSGDTYLGEVSPQDRQVLYIDLLDTMFTWDNHEPDPDNPLPLTSAQIRRARLDVRVSNNRVIDDATVNASQSRIEVRFLRELAGVRDVDFSFDVILSVDGRQQRDHALNFGGTFANPVIEVFANTTREDISLGEIAEAQESVRSIVFDVGEGVSVTTRMNNGSRVFAVASLTPDDRDENFFIRHREVEWVVNLRTVGLNSNATTVDLGRNFRAYYVYSADGTFLGRGYEALPLESKYYLAVARLSNVGNGNESTPPHAEPTPPDGGSVPDTDASSATTAPPGNQGNANFNPPTGR